MYPVHNTESYPYRDITPQKNVEYSKFKIKGMNQIEKFNQRYQKMLDKD